MFVIKHNMIYMHVKMRRKSKTYPQYKIRYELLISKRLVEIRV